MCPQGANLDTFQEVLRLLIPGCMNRVFWDIILYLILLFAIIVMAMQPEGSFNVTLMMAAVIIAVFVDKIQLFGLCGLEVLLIRIVMFLGPLITAGITQNPKARAPAVITAGLALFYTFILWALELNSVTCPCTPRDVGC